MIDPYAIAEMAAGLTHWQRALVAGAGISCLFAALRTLEAIVAVVRENGIGWDSLRAHTLLTLPALGFWVGLGVVMISLSVAPLPPSSGAVL